MNIVPQNDSPPQGETYKQLVARITQEVIGDGEDLTVDQAKRIVWLVAEALSDASQEADHD